MAGLHLPLTGLTPLLAAGAEAAHTVRQPLPHQPPPLHHDQHIPPPVKLAPSHIMPHAEEQQASGPHVEEEGASPEIHNDTLKFTFTHASHSR